MLAQRIIKMYVQSSIYRLNTLTDREKEAAYAMGKEEIMTPEQIAQLPLQAVLVIACIALWRSYVGAMNARVDDLKTVIANLNSRMLMVEDKLGIKPPLTNTTFDAPDIP